MTEPTDPTGRDLLDERMDQRLRDAGTRWRDSLPAPAPAEARPPVRRSHRRWLVPAAAAASVVLVIGAAWAIGRDGEPASPDVSRRTDVGTCERGSLQVTGGVVEERRSYRSVTGRVELKGDQPCLLSGYPEAVPRGAGRLPAAAAQVALSSPPGEVLVEPSAPATVTVRVRLSGLDCWSARIDAVELTLPDGDRGELPGLGGLCEPGGGPVTLEVLPIGVGSAPPSDAAPATVRGTVTLDGGPQGRSSPVTSGEISFDGGSSGAGASIGPDGTYQVELPAGEYDVTVTTPDWNGGEPYRDGRYGVTGGTTSELDVHIPIR